MTLLTGFYFLYLYRKSNRNKEYPLSNKNYGGITVSRFIAAYWNKEHADINLTKIMKLTYLLYGIHLSMRGERLFNEHPQAWPFGPVFPNIRIQLLRSDYNAISLDSFEFKDISEDEDIIRFVDILYGIFGKCTQDDLIQWTTGIETPWYRVKSTWWRKWGKEIPDSYIEQYNDIFISSVVEYYKD
jgi:uncharacterized phage-associated protein